MWVACEGKSRGICCTTGAVLVLLRLCDSATCVAMRSQHGSTRSSVLALTSSITYYAKNSEAQKTWNVGCPNSNSSIFFKIHKRKPRTGWMLVSSTLVPQKSTGHTVPTCANMCQTWHTTRPKGPSPDWEPQVSVNTFASIAFNWET